MALVPPYKIMLRTFDFRVALSVVVWTHVAGLLIIVSCADLVSWCSAPTAIPPLKMEGMSIDDSSPRKGDASDGHSPMSPV